MLLFCRERNFSHFQKWKTWIGDHHVIQNFQNPQLMGQNFEYACNVFVQSSGIQNSEKLMTVKIQNHEIIDYFSDWIFLVAFSEIYCGGICTPLARIIRSLRECSGIKCSGISITLRWPGDKSCCIFITAFWTVLWILSTLWKEFPSFFTQLVFLRNKWHDDLFQYISVSVPTLKCQYLHH